MSIYTFVFGYLLAASIYDIGKFLVRNLVFAFILKRQIVKALQAGQQSIPVSDVEKPIEPLMKKPTIN